jgi:hypothetical protein
MIMAQQTCASGDRTAEESTEHQELKATLSCLAAAHAQEQQLRLELEHAQQDFDKASTGIEELQQQIEGLETELKEKMNAVPPCTSRVQQLQGCVARTCLSG